jgi:hypothetical protein
MAPNQLQAKYFPNQGLTDAGYIFRINKKEDTGIAARCLPEGRKCALGACLQILPILSYTTVIPRIKCHILLNPTNPSA